MPRNSQGLYTLPAGNPVVPNTLIEANWANPTMDDIAAALTGSLPRDGSAPMTGPLTLSADAPTQPRHAISKGYLEQFLAYATGMPIGSVVAYAGASVPSGYFECNGQAVSRTTYADLFATIGTIYGAGDASTTFNVPDMRDEFIRGKSAARAVGSKQAGSFASHTHTYSDPGHAHGQAAHTHNITTGAHSHGVNDPGHSHGDGVDLIVNGASGDSLVPAPWVGSTSVAGTGISIQAAGNLGGSTDVQNPAVVAATTGISIGATGDGETVPQNMAQIYIIKAVDDAGSITGIVGLTSSDVGMIDIGVTNPAIPELLIKSNVAFGTVKLDAGGKVPLNQMPTSSSQFLGYFDASSGNLPAGPATSGDYYAVSVQGTLTVYDPVTLTASPTLVPVGSQLHYVTGSLTNPTGWYTLTVSGATLASDVQFIPTGTISATTVQAALAELDSETQTALSGKAPSSASTGAGTSFPPSGSISASNVTAAIQELDTEVYTALSGKAPASAETAAGTSFTPTGSVSAVTVQAAIVELSTEKVAGSVAGTVVNVNDYVGVAALEIDQAAKTIKGINGYGLQVPQGPAFAAQGSVMSLGAGLTTKALVNTELFDTNDNYDAANSRFTPTVEGYYQVSADGGNQSALDTFGFYIFIYKNGSGEPIAQDGSTGNATAYAKGSASGLVYMNGTTDYLEVLITGTGPSGNVNVVCANFSAFLARAA